MKFKYKYTKFDFTLFNEKFRNRLTRELNKHGKEGWELIQFKETFSDTICYFKQEQTNDNRRN